MDVWAKKAKYPTNTGFLRRVVVIATKIPVWSFFVLSAVVPVHLVQLIVFGVFIIAKSFLSDFLLRPFLILLSAQGEYFLFFRCGSVLNCLPGPVSGGRCPVLTVVLMLHGISGMSPYPEKRSKSSGKRKQLLAKIYKNHKTLLKNIFSKNFVL